MFLSLLHVNVGDDATRPRPGRLWLRDVYRVHQRLWMAFPDQVRREQDPFFLGAWEAPNGNDPSPTRAEAGFLFRVERDASARILVQSAQRPDWSYAFQNAPYLLAKEPELREYDPAPCRDQAYRFRLLANVVQRKSYVRPDGRTRTTAAGLTIARKRRGETLIHPKPVPECLPADPAERRHLLLARWDPWREWLANVGVLCGFHVVERRESPLLMEAVHMAVRNPGKRGGAPNENKDAEWRFNAGLFNGVLVCTDEERLRKALIGGIGSGKAFGFGLLSLARVSQ